MGAAAPYAAIAACGNTRLPPLRGLSRRPRNAPLFGSPAMLRIALGVKKQTELKFSYNTGDLEILMKYKVSRATKTFLTFIFIAWGLFGLISMLVQYINVVKVARFNETAVETSAVITDIHSQHRSIRYRVYVVFDAGGRPHKGKFTIYREHGKFSMQEGETIQIFHSPKWDKIRYAGDAGKSTAEIINPFVLLSAAVGLAFMARKNILKKRLFQHGKKVMASFLRFECSRSRGGGRIGSLLVISEYRNKADSKTYCFISEEFEIPCRPSDKELEGALVPVYVKENDYSKYYVDIDSFFNDLAA